MKLETHGVRVALVALGAGLLMTPAAPAGAATGQVGFSCSGPGFGTAASYPFTAVVDTDLPQTLPYGAARTTTWTTTVVAPDAFRSWAQEQGFTTLYAGAKVTAALDGVAQPELKEGTPPLSVPATAGDWTWNIRPVTSSQQATTSGKHTFTVTKLELTVAFYDASGPRWATSATCVLDPATPASATVVDTYDVVAAPTTTALAIKNGVATATITSPGVTPTGTVTFSVADQSVVAEVKAGKAAVKLPTVRPGTQTVTAAFTPSNVAQLAASSTTATVVVPRIATTTTVNAVRRPARGLIRARAKVSATDRSVVTGAVTFLLKRNGRTIENTTTSLSRSAAGTTRFRGLPARGRYVVVAKYVSSDSYLGSRDRTRLS